MAPRDCAGFFYMNRKERVAVYIDGFNLYHSLVEAAANSNLGYSVKWFDIKKMLHNKVGKNKSIVSIKYFTAMYPNNSKKRRHKHYIKVLKDTGIEVVLGRFKIKDVTCKTCNNQFKTHEEKRTDVNIALHLLQDFHLDVYDTAVIISGDTDLIPAIQMVRNSDSTKKVGVLAPYNRLNNELRRVASFTNKIDIPDIESAILPNPYVHSVTGVNLTKPVEWA